LNRAFAGTLGSRGGGRKGHFFNRVHAGVDVRVKAVRISGAVILDADAISFDTSFAVL